jgi:hypothetical protein
LRGGGEAAGEEGYGEHREVKTSATWKIEERLGKKKMVAYPEEFVLFGEGDAGVGG